MFSFFTGGLALIDDDRGRLDEMTTLVDHATSEILRAVDWSANMQLVDQVNTIANPIMYGFCSYSINHLILTLHK
jgi:hypothetical protein